jgi:hypothetical protein
MDQVAATQSQLKIIEIADKALSEGGDLRFAQVIAWLAHARSAAPGYLDTWAPDEIDLVASLSLYDDLDDDERDFDAGPRR